MQFSRTVAPDTSKGPALIAFMQHNRWRKIVILSSTQSIWFETRLGLAEKLAAAGIKILKPAAFEPGNINDAMLRDVRQSGIRIVFVLAYDDDARTVASLAQRDGMNAGFAWVLSSEVLPVPALLGWIWFRTFLVSGMRAFAKQVSDYSKSHFNSTVSPDSVGLQLSVALHDAVMLYAHAATKVLSEGGDLEDGEAVTKAVRSTEFVGAGGQIIDLDESGDPIESYELMNIVMGVASGFYNASTYVRTGE